MEPPREMYHTFSLVILIPPIYDHSQVRITHGSPAIDIEQTHVLQCNSVEPGTIKRKQAAQAARDAILVVEE